MAGFRTALRRPKCRHMRYFDSIEMVLSISNFSHSVPTARKSVNMIVSTDIPYLTARHISEQLRSGSFSYLLFDTHDRNYACLPNQAEGPRRISLVMGSISFSDSLSASIFTFGCFVFIIAVSEARMPRVCDIKLLQQS